MIKVIGFDLDNTLYEHGQYVESAYRNISNFVGEKYGLDKVKYFEWIFARWKEKGSSYNKIFEESYINFGIGNFNEDIKHILETYHSAIPSLTAYDGTVGTLGILAESYKLIIITDGRERTQLFKIKQLGLDGLFCRKYISGSFSRDYYKPSTGMFEMCLKDEGIKTDEMLYIGDHPVLDYEPCKKLGIRFVRMLSGEYTGFAYENDLQIKSIKELPGLIDTINKESAI